MTAWIDESSGIEINIIPLVEGERSVIIALPQIFGEETSRRGVVHPGAQVDQLNVTIRTASVSGELCSEPMDLPRSLLILLIWIIWAAPGELLPAGPEAFFEIPGPKNVNFRMIQGGFPAKVVKPG